MELDLVQTDDLLEELDRRFDAVIFMAAAKKMEHSDGRATHEWLHHCKGSIFMRVGLARALVRREESQFEEALEVEEQ